MSRTAVIQSISPSGYDGTFRINSVTASTTFTYLLPNNPGSYVSGGQSSIEPNVLIGNSSPIVPSLVVVGNPNSVPLTFDPSLPILEVVGGDGNKQNDSVSIEADGHSMETWFGNYVREFSNGFDTYWTGAHDLAWSNSATSSPENRSNLDTGIARNAAGVVEINTGVPLSDIYGPSNLGSLIASKIGIGTTTVASANLFVQGTSSNPTIDVLNVASSSGASYLDVKASGNVGIGTTSPSYLLYVGSASVASGTVAQFQNANGTCAINPTLNTLACSSDERLKKDIIPYGSDALDQIMALQPVFFNWNAETSGTPEHPGFIAQQVQQIMPEVVSTDPTTGLLSIGYSDIVPAVVSAMQQMQTEITTLQGGLNGNASTSNLTVYSPSSFSGDSVGEAEIPAGQTSVRVSFSQPYEYQPIVTFSPEGVFTPGFIAEKDGAGFTLAIPAATTTAVTFDWHSFASPNEQLTVTGGTPKAITLVVATSAPAGDQPLTVSGDSVSFSTATPSASDSSATGTPDVVGTSTPASDQGSGDSTVSAASSSTPPSITPTPTIIPTPTPTPAVSPTPAAPPAPSPSLTPTPAPTATPADSGTPTGQGSDSGS